ncbi:MAG: RDD family protein [Xanthomonadales bacterium]|nr:RDD family protein [Xanthomonadales bacterium]
MKEPVPAPLWLRLAALGYDLLVLVAVWMLVAALVLAAFGGDVDVAHQPPLYHVVLQAALLVSTGAYFALSWARAGRTIGMRAWHLRLVDAAGGRAPSARQSLLRFAVAMVSALAVGLGFAWCLVDRERRGWHDLAARTRLERVPRGG